MGFDRRVVGIGIVAATIMDCSLITDLSSLTAQVTDASTPEAAPGTFLISASPAHVTLDPTESTPIAIGITRGQDFTDIVDVTVNDVGNLNGISTAPQTLTFTGSAPVTLNLTVVQSATTPQDGTITLLGIGRSTQKSTTATFGVRIGSLFLDTTTTTSVTVPPWATALWIKAWGAGGGAGGGVQGTDNSYAMGGGGGTGGLAGALLSVQPGGTLAITVGEAGKTSSWGAGGGGGGYSRVDEGQDVLIVAGGGGGGGTAWAGLPPCGGVQSGAAGGMGGGGSATGANAATTNQGGAAGDPTAFAGSSFNGGNGSGATTAGTDGGAPGGGSGGQEVPCGGDGGGGGGGGGFFGGGGGAAAGKQKNAGGGGGSGFIADGGSDAVAISGPTALSDLDYKAGTATGGTSAPSPSKPGVAGTGGRVLIHFRKP